MATIGEYEEAYRLYDNLLEGSDFSYAPWHLINGEDKRRANLKITETLVDALEKALHAKKDPAALAAAAKRRPTAPGAAVEEIPLEGRSPEQQRAVARTRRGAGGGADRASPARKPLPHRRSRSQP